MEIGKIKFRIIEIIFVIALLLPIVMIVKEEVKVDMAIANTKKILSNIDADEFQEEIIKKLKKSNLNLNTSYIKTYFEVFKDMDDDILEMCTYSSKDDDLKNFVFAFIVDEYEKEGIAIPLFKINRYKDDTFATIEYYNFGYNDSVTNAINNVLEKEYDIKGGTYAYHGIRYSQKFQGSYHKPSQFGPYASIKYKDRDVANEILKKVEDTDYIFDSDYESKRAWIWGLLD